MNAVNECWNLLFGIPIVGYYANNGTELRNMKMDEWVSKLGIRIMFAPSYSLWSNGLNERNHTLVDLTIKKMMEE